MITQEISTSGEFEARFREMNRGDEFSPEGFEALFEYLDNLSEELEEDIKLDVIALCCDFSERTRKDIEDEVREYEVKQELEEAETEEEKEEILNDAVEEWLDERAIARLSDGSAIVGPY